MTSWVEGDRSFFIGSTASLIPDDRETAASWASPHIVHNAAYRYVMGRFVEADRANSNRQLFSLAGLQMARPTITHAPMNMSHDTRRVVGAYIATDLIYPTGSAARADMSTEDCPNCGAPHPVDAGTCPECGEDLPPRDTPGATSAKLTAANLDDAGLNPYIDALGVFWRHYYPEEYALVEAAHAAGRLYFSMECVPSQIACKGEGGCNAQFEYAGRQSPTYCEHLNKGTSDKFLIDPHFTAGAILVPPVRPGWSKANVHSLVAKHSEFADRLYESIAYDAPHLNASDWEATMAELLVLASQ